MLRAQERELLEDEESSDFGSSAESPTPTVGSSVAESQEVRTVYRANNKASGVKDADEDEVAPHGHLMGPSSGRGPEDSFR